MPYHPVGKQQSHGILNEKVRQRMAVQIVDEPAACGMTIHPLDKADQFTVSKMVGKKRAYDEIGAPRRIQREDVGCLEANRGVFWRDLLSRLFGPRVKGN